MRRARRRASRANCSTDSGEQSGQKIIRGSPYRAVYPDESARLMSTLLKKSVGAEQIRGSGQLNRVFPRHIFLDRRAHATS